jgi:catechol 2,3-dioxygenase-like lactoylglutathione lyase family enzyme
MQIKEVRIKLYVADFDARRSFYRDTLKWPITHEWDEPLNHRGVMFQVGGAIFELLEDLSSKAHDGESDLSLEVPDVWALWKSLGDLVDVEFLLRDNDWGDTSFCVIDPGGFRLTFFSPHRDGVKR